MDSGNIKPAFMSSISVMKSTCGMVRLVPWYPAAVLSYQLVLKLAEILDSKLKTEVLISVYGALCLLLYEADTLIHCFHFVPSVLRR